MRVTRLETLGVLPEHGSLLNSGGRHATAHKQTVAVQC